MKKVFFPCFLLVLLLVFPVLSSGQRINMRHVQQSWTTDTTNHIVPLSEFRILLRRDAIRPVDTPRFVAVRKAADLYYENEPVGVITVGKKTRAYPLSVLMFHEIVNDRIGGTPLSVTYCPLCNSVRVFDRTVEIDGMKKVLDFGTTGMLRKSNLVMWDRQTETWWQQFTGIGVVGKYAGLELNLLPSMILSFGDYRKCFPGGEVLTMAGEKGGPPYGMNPYVKYDSIGRQPRLFFGKMDERLPALERVVHIEANDMDKIYPYPLLVQEKVVNDDPGGVQVVIFYRKGMQSVLDEKDIRKGRDIGNAVVFLPVVEGKTLTFVYDNGKFTDKETGSQWCISGKCISGKMKGKKLQVYPYAIDFAFAVFAFYPGVDIYGRQGDRP